MARYIQASLAFAAVLFAVPALLPSPALAEPPYPTVDFQGDWVLSDGKDKQMQARMHYSAEQKKMRIDLDQQGMAMSSVRDMDSGEMIMWSNQMKGMAMRLPTMKDDEFDGERTSETKTVNGETCTIWTLKQVQACLTEENIPLETTAEGFAATLNNVQRTTQDATLFEVPDGLNVMEMPANALGKDGMIPGQGLPF